MTSRKSIQSFRGRNQTIKTRSRGRNRRLLLERLEDRRLLATYALQSEVFAQTALGGPMTGATGDGLGSFVTLSDDGGVAIVGAPEADGGKGAVYAYQRDNNGTPADQTDDSWGFFASISAPDGAAGDNFGASIAISEAMLVIGAPGADVAVTDQGAVYVFDTQNGFAMTKLTLSSPQTGDRFGATVAATNSGTRIVAGAPLFDGAGTDRGGVFVFENSGAGWSAPVALTAPVSEDGAQFGAAVALDANSAVVGAPLEDTGGADRGSAYLFTYDPDTSNWSAGTSLLPGGTVTLNAGDRYGAAVGVNQGFIVVGSPGAPGAGVGGAHVFADMGGGLGHVYSPDVGPSGLNLPAGANYGAAVAAVGGAQPRAAVGAPGIDAGGGADQGGVHVFGPGMADEFFAGTAAGDRFGSALAMLGNTLVVGAPLRDNGTTVDTGAAAIYGPTTPPQPMDFGDAKSLYGTRLNDDGPRHVVGALYLGASIDAEMDATETWDASGDDFTGIDDEDGVTLPGNASFDGALLVIGDAATVNVTLSRPGRIDAWLDLNANEQFDLPAEQILSTDTLAAGPNTLTFFVPSDTNPGPWGQSMVRFRLSSAGGLPPTGPAQDGEVEDYFVQFGVRPVAAFQMSPSPLEYGSDLTLDASGSYDPPPKASGISVYEWDLDNDGQFDDLVSHNTVDLVPWETLKNLGLQIGVNPIQLRVTDFDGLTAVTSQNLEIFIGPNVVVPLPSSGSVQELSRSGSNLLVRDVNQNTITFQAPFSAVSSLTVTGDRGNDTLIVDFARGNPIPADGLRLNGQGFEDFDTLEIRGADIELLVNTFTGPQSGTIEFDGSTIEYTGLEPVLIDSDGSLANASFTLPAGAAPYGPGTTIPGGCGYSASGSAAGLPGGVTRWYTPADLAAFTTGFWGLTNNFYATTQQPPTWAPWGFDTGVSLSGPSYMSNFNGTFYAPGSNLAGGVAVWYLPSVALDTDGNNVPNGYVPVYMTLTVTNTAGTPVPLMYSPGGLGGSLGVVYQINPANGTGGAFRTNVRMEVGNYGGMGTPVVTYYDSFYYSTGNGGAVTSFASGFWTDKEYVYLEDNGNATDGLVQFRSGNGTFETTTFSNPTGSLTVNAQGNTLVRVSTLDNGFAATNLNLNGQATDTYRTTAANVVPDGTDLAVNTATYDLNGYSDTIDALTGSGTVDNSAAGAATLTVASGNFAGMITDSGASTLALTKTSGGVLTLSGANSYAGTTTVDAGTLLVNGTNSGAGTVVINNNATLGGTGTLAGAVQLNNTSRLAPGTSVESLGVGAVSWSSGTFFDVEIDGTAGAGITGGHDVLNVSGSVALGSATLAVDLGFTPTAGNAFKILNKAGAGAITGTFNNLPEGKVFSAGGATFQITYQGGDGNDVVLTTLDAANPTLTGTPVGDYFVVKKNGSFIEVYQGTAPNPTTMVYSAALSGLTTLTIDGLDGNDTTTVDFGAGNPLPNGGLTFNGAGQTGTPGDVLQIVGGTQGNVVYNYTNAHDGSIVLQNYGTISYTGLEPITNSGSATDVVFNLPGGGDQAQLKNLGGGMLRLESTAGVPTFEQTDFATPSGSLTINSDGNAGLPTLLGTFDFSSPRNEMDVDPNGDLVYIASSMGGSGLIRVNASNPASMSSTSLPYGGGVAVDPVTGRYATTSGYGGGLYVYNGNDTLYDSEGLIGCGGHLAAGNGTFGISTQCTDRFHIYNESTASITVPANYYHGTGSWVTYNGATDRYYWRTDPSTTYVYSESPPADVGSISGYFVAEANPVTNRLYALNTSTWTLNVLDGTTHAVTATIPGAAGDVAVDTALDRIYFIQGGAISVYNGAGTASLGTISLPVGYTPDLLDMAVGDDRLYVVGHPASGPNRLFVMQTGGAAAGNDTLTVDLSGGDAVPAGGLIYNGGDGDDKLSVDLANDANRLSANSITFSGGGQTSGDSIEVLNAPDVGGRGTDYIADTSGAANSGRIVVNPGGSGGAGDKEMKIYFTGLAPSTVSGSGPLDVIVNVDAATTVDVKDVGTSSDGWNIVDGNSTFEDVTFSGYTTLNVYSGNGAETITLQALDSAGAVTTINLSGDNFAGTDTGNDTFDIQASPAGVTVNLIGGAGDDTFQMKVNVSGTINGGSGGETNGDKLDVSGHGTAQVVDLGNRSVTGLFAGAANGFANIEDFVGDGSNDTLRGTGSADTFTVSGQNDGTLSGGVTADFTDFSKLEGVGGNDTFTFNASLTGSASGGDGDDTFNLSVNVVGTIDGGATGQTNGDKLNVSGHGTAQVVDLGNSSVTGLFAGAANGFANIEDFVGDGSNDTLRGTGSGDTFTVSGPNDGTVSGGVAADFTDFSKLEGVGGNDTFTFNANLTGSASGGAGDDTFNSNVNVSGTIDGGSGGETNGDKLDVSGHAAAQLVNLSNSSVTGLFGGAANGFANIEAFTGDGSNDTLVGANAVQTWNITGANDGNIGGTTSFTDFSNLTGGTANDTFAFGASGSLSGNLNGGAGSNTLDYSSYGTGVTVDLDKTTAPGAPLISGTIASIQNFLGTTLADTLSVDALAGGVARTVNGNSGATPNVLNVDAKGQTATDNGLQITFGGGYGTITYTNFQTVNITGAALTITGDGNNNTLTVTASNSNSGYYQLDGGPTVNFSNVTAFQFDGLAGNDTLIINNPSGSVFGPTGGITFNGGTETVADTLTLSGGGGAGFTETYTVGPAADEGTIVTTNGSVTQTIHFTGLEPINDTVQANLDIYATDAANTIQVVNGTAGRVQVTIDAFEAMDFSNKTNVTVHGGDSTAGGDGIDTITVDFTNSASGLVSLSINADDANDAIEVKNTANNISLTINGNAGTDTLSFTTNPLSLSASAGLTLSVATTETIDVNQNLTALGGITFTSPTTTYLGASLQTDGNAVSITGGTVIIDAAIVVVDTESNNAGNAGNVSLGNTSIRPDAANRDLTIDARGGAGGSGGTVTLGTLTNTAGAFVDDLSIDAGGAADGNVILNQSAQTASSILIQNAITVDVNGDLTAGTTLTIQSAATVDLVANVDLAAGGALSVATNVTVINLSGATGTTNIIDGNGDASVTLANITATSSPNLTVNSEGAVSMGSANIGATGAMSIAVDNNNSGTEAGTFGALSAGSLNITGSSGNNDITFNGPGTSDVATSVSVTEAGAIDVNAKITAGTTVVMTASDNITIDAAIDPTTVTLTSGDDVLVNAPVSAPTLITVQAGQDGSGSVSVDGTAPETGSLTTTGAAPNSDIDITAGASSGGIALGGNVTAVDRLTLTSNAASGSGGGVNQTSGTVTAANLQLSGTSGSFTLTQPSNNFGTVAAQTDGGSVSLTDTNSILVGTVVTSGIDTGSTGNGAAVTINATSGTITVNQAINTSTGTGGGVSISGSVVINAALTAGAGTITLNGNPNGAFNLDINASITSDLTINLTAPRDILVRATLQTTGSGADIVLTADSDGDSVGGVRIEAAGQLVSKDAVTLTGSDLYDTTGLIGTPSDSVRVDADGGAAVQITAEGAVLLQSGANAQAGADIFINGLVETTVLGDITVNALDTIQLGANLTAKSTAADKIDLQDPVVLTAGVTLAAGSTGINFASTVNGGFDLVLNTSGSTAFNGAVGNSAPVGDGTGAAITINSTSNTRFYSTVQTASGISATDTTATVQFDGNVTIGAGNTASTFNGSVTLDGLTMNAGRSVTFGDNAANDQVTLSGGAVAINTTANNGNLTFNAKIDGAQNLTMSTHGAGDVDFNGLIGSVTPPSSLTVSAADTTTFDAAAIVAGNITTTSAGLTAINADLTSNTGNIDLRSTGGSVSQANGTTVLATAGGVRMRTDTGNVTVFNVTAGANNFPNHVPTANTAAIKMDVAGTFTQNGVLTATSAPNLNIDIDPVDEFIHGDETATGHIYHSASNDITVDTNAKLEADSDNSGGGTLQMIADNDAVGGGDLLATDGTQLIGAVVSLSGYNVTVDVVQGKTGNVTITGANNVTLNDNVSAGPATGNVDVQATAGTLHQTGGNILAGGFVELDAGTLVNLDGTTGAVTPIGGDVRINTNLTGPVQIDGNVTANGAVTVGRSDYTGGAVTIGSAVACTVTSDADSSGAEDVTIRASGAISQVAGTINANTGGVFIRSAASTVSVVDVNSAGGSQLQPSIITTYNAANPAAAIQIRASDTATVAGIDATGGGAIVEIVSDAAGIVLYDVDATTTVFLQAGGAITDGFGDTTNNVTAVNLVMTAATGIGTSGNHLETTVSNLEAAGGMGGVYVDNTTALTIGGITALEGVSATGGNIRVTTAGWQTVNEEVVNSGGGYIRLDADGNLDTVDLTINANVTATGGDGYIMLYAGDSISLAATVTVSAAGSGIVEVEASEDYNGADASLYGRVVMGDGSAILSEDGTIYIFADGDILLSRVNADSDGDLAAGGIDIRADYPGDGAPISEGDGAIVDNLTGEAPNLVGSWAELQAGDGIGSGVAGDLADIDTAIATLAAATESGDINIQNIGTGLTIENGNNVWGVTILDDASDDSGDDDITIVTRAGLTVNAGNPIANHDGGDITLRAEGGGGYQLILGSFTFPQAQADAAARDGYVATIRSAAENAVVAGIAGGAEVWIGATDAASEGDWLWWDERTTPGPDKGIQFWSGFAAGSPVGGEYNNWAAGQPDNDADQDAAYMQADGTWNDWATTGPLTRPYVLEFADADLVVNATVTVSGGTGAISLEADTDVTGDAAGDITTANGNVTITADLDDSSFAPNVIGTIHLDGDITAGTGTVTLSLPDCDGYLGSGLNLATGQGTSVNGSIVSASQVIKNGAGALRLNGTANAYVGTTTVNAGALLVNGAITTDGGAITVVGAGALLGGNGTIGATTAGRDIVVNAGGTLDPGDVDPGNCAIHYPGLLTVKGDVTFAVGGIFRVQLNSLNAGVDSGTYTADGYDQLDARGFVNLGGNPYGSPAGATLRTDAGYGFPVGAEFTVLVNDITTPPLDPPWADIHTRFQTPGGLQLDEGEFFTTGGTSNLMNISYYTKSDNNDVTLTHPGRYDFDGYHGYTETNYEGISPFTLYGSGPAGWQTLPPQYFERQYTAVPPCTAIPEPLLQLDGHSTDNVGTPLTFEVDVVADPAPKMYEVLILTGDVYWNHDKEKFTLTWTDPSGTGTVSTSQTVDTWGGGAPDGSGVKVTSGGGITTSCPGYYRWVRLTTSTVVGDLGSGLGKLYVTLQDLGGYDPATVILAMDIRPVETVGEITLERIASTGSGADNTDPFSELPADGVTIDSYQGTGAPPYSTITITVSALAPAPDSTMHYATLLTDADPSMFGTQVTANSSGLFSFTVQRPSTLADTAAATENWMVLAEERSGLSRGSATQVYGKPAAEALRFDFGIYGSPVQTYGTPVKSFLQVIPQTTYNATRGYGWTSRVAGAWRKDTVNAGTGSNLRTDLNYARNATFKVDLPNGDYSVRVYHSNPMYYGTVPYIADNFQVWAEGSLRYTVDNIVAGTTWPLASSTFGVTVVGGALEIQFLDVGGRDGNFVVSGIDISAAGQLPGDTPLLAAGDPLDGGAPAISVDMLQPVAAEAAARWSAAGLTAAQAATLANVRFAVADLGGAYLGLANPATNTIRIDDDAAMLGWSLGKYEVGSAKVEGIAVSPFTLLPSNFGVDLLTVVMHEMGHLLGYEHSADDHDLMAPVLSASPLRTSAVHDALSPDLSLNLSPNLSPLTLRSSSSRADDLFADLGRKERTAADGSDANVLALFESADGGLLAARTAKSSDEATQARVPRRSRMERFERELDDWFAELAAEEEVAM